MDNVTVRGCAAFYFPKEHSTQHTPQPEDRMAEVSLTSPIQWPSNLQQKQVINVLRTPGVRYEQNSAESPGTHTHL